MRKILHVEGIPGAGKSTTAQRTAELLSTQTTVPASWVLEEADDHPIMPREKRRQSRQPDFATICLTAWEEFVRTNEQMIVLDGYAFQHTVRFLYANDVSRKRIDEFFDAWQIVGGHASTMIFLAVNDPVAHLQSLLSERGEKWTKNLVAYVEHTNIAQRHAWHGDAGFIEFWVHYQSLCLELLQRLKFPHEVIPARSWTDGQLNKLALSLCDA
ncbi:MAG: hypothetical protein GKR90_24015 [Pseudomonadales bacterium]|nr:hypothetical protein [Pseudomonadales bacterium]